MVFQTEIEKWIQRTLINLSESEMKLFELTSAEKAYSYNKVFFFFQVKLPDGGNGVCLPLLVLARNFSEWLGL